MTAPSLSELVERIRREQGLTIEVPGFDPLNGNERAKFLFVLEAPGPKALETGRISFDNPDITARNFRTQLQASGIQRADIAVWNIVPWYLGNQDRTRIRGATARDVKQGLAYLSDVISLMPQLCSVVLVGGAARQAHVHLSHSTRARILSCHHPSPKVQNIVEGAAEENVAVFRRMLALAA
jgi:uracil-DNA glycosylase